METIIYLLFSVVSLALLMLGFHLGRNHDRNINKPVNKPENNPNNPFHIPDLTPMYEALRDFIKKHQGDKGYILTDNDGNDTIWGLIYDESDRHAVEVQVKAVRVTRHGDIEVIVDYDDSVVYDDDSVAEADKADTIYGAWLDLKYDDNLYYIHTIYSLADSIQEYI